MKDYSRNYREAGGTRESVVDGVSGVLVDDRAGFVTAIGGILADPERRDSLGRGARVTSHAYTWQHAQESFATVLRAALAGRRIDHEDPRLTAGED